MSRLNWKGSALLAPLPSVMVTCGTAEKSNIITIGWCGVVSTRPARIYISVRPERHSHALISESGEFVVNLVPSSLAEVCDYVGTVTGRLVDKAAKTGLTLIPSETVAPPTVADSPLALECRVAEVLHEGTHDMFIADVVNVSVDETLVDEHGKLRLDRAKLLVFSHGEYFEIGRRIGKIGMAYENGKKGKKAVVKAKASAHTDTSDAKPDEKAPDKRHYTKRGQKRDR